MNADLEKLFGRETARMYGHLWYSDRCLGEFVTAAERRLERPVFALTGDHFSRRFPANQRPTTYQRKAVPLVLYGRKALAQISPPSGMAGSHLDIVPTLVNLAAPRGFLFHAVGHDLLEASQPQLGFGADAIVGANFIVENSASAIIEDLDGKAAQAPSSAEALQLQFRRRQALGWWRSLKGSELVARSGTQTNGAK